MGRLTCWLPYLCHEKIQHISKSPPGCNTSIHFAERSNMTNIIQNRNPDLLVMTCYYRFLSVGDVARLLVTMRGIIPAEQRCFQSFLAIRCLLFHVHFQWKQNKSCSTSCGWRGKYSLVVLKKKVSPAKHSDSATCCITQFLYHLS